MKEEEKLFIRDISKNLIDKAIAELSWINMMLSMVSGNSPAEYLEKNHVKKKMEHIQKVMNDLCSASDEIELMFATLPDIE